jgi:16S rRNA (guanine966-N2)-methyltransferase
VRIIAGELKGQIISSPKGHKTHPMSERMRGSLFNTLGDISGLKILDAYAGSGSLGIEALSRGASYVLFIDSDKNAASVIMQNLGKLKLVGSKVTKANIASWSDHNFETTFDIVLADPPYNQVNENHFVKIGRNVGKNGLLVISLPKSYQKVSIENFAELVTKNFADGSIRIYQRMPKVSKSQN